jgi:hypothetical protein
VTALFIGNLFGPVEDFLHFSPRLPAEAGKKDKPAELFA